MIITSFFSAVCHEKNPRVLRAFFCLASSFPHDQHCACGRDEQADEHGNSQNPVDGSNLVNSVGGPVVAPQCACLVLSPVAPHNLTMRPVVIPSSSDVRLKVHARHAEISIATDNETCPIPEGAEFKVRLASRRFFLAVPHNISFYDTLRKKMMWGVDIRS